MINLIKMPNFSMYRIKSCKSSSNSYTVTYNHDKEYYSCTCPDYVHRCSKTNEMCKHITKIKNLDDKNADRLEFLYNDVELIVDETSSLAEKINTTSEDSTHADELAGEIEGGAAIASSTSNDDTDESAVKLLLDIVTNQQKIINTTMGIVSSSFEKLKLI